MNTLSQEAIETLKRQDADDALQSAALVGWNKAIQTIASLVDDWDSDLVDPRDVAAGIRSLAKQENTK